ncbi:DUF2970 domain-containing protein [Paenalcaligenes niemegkensis]|uniref:DUF2970 domain-containing protein n=1 Tax=Paenalcaligenes niemegkensis TaxID=2895469 RepID=UPI001EE7CA5B|nr:DUF2970 domain-containing protein [Paenalcaligenes niemegkensis]MCQ9617721.1 DUF2970 domain-containing protein [Paenalcaligenes niemegkensis]
MNNDMRDLTRRKMSLKQTVKAIAWGALGVRRGKGHSDDIATLNPLVLIAVALIATVFFVVALVFIARLFIGYLS